MGTLLLFFVIVFNFCTVLCGLAQGYGTPVVTTLTANIDSVVATIPVESTSGFAASDFVWVGGERMSYVGTDPTNLLNATRPAPDQNGLGATSATHSAGTQVYTDGMNALNALLGVNYTSLQLTYGAPVAFIWSVTAYISAIPRFIYWNVGFMQGSAWSLIKIIVLFPLSAAFMLGLIFWLFQLVWMLKPNIP